MKTKTPRGAFLFGLLVIGCLVVSPTLTGCKNEPDPKSGNAITSFKIGDAAGAILNDEISVIVPAGTSLTAVSPVITLSEGARVLPASGTANNFTNPTTYAVTAENGSVRTFVVTVTSIVPELKSGNAITGFKIGNAAGAIQGDTVSVIVPADTVLTALQPTITFSDGAAVVPASGAANDFTNPTTYTVTAENGNVRTFVVTVTPAASVVLENIEIISLPYKTNYQTGEAFVIDGLVVRGHYSDGSSKTETITAANITNFNAAKEGRQDLVVTVGGKTAVLSVTVTPIAPIVLEYIQIISNPYKTNYQKGEALDITGLVVQGHYSDGSSKAEDVTMDNVSNYNADREGQQDLVVTVGGKITVLQVNVYPADVTSSLNLTAGLIKDGDDEITIYGIPEEGIILSVDKNNNRYDKMTISLGASGNNVYSSISWWIDGVSAGSSNIKTIYASDYTYTIPHTITIRATKDGVEYSKNITFTVVR